MNRTSRLALFLGCVIFAGACVTGIEESTGAREEPGREPGMRVCLGDGEGLHPCAERRVSIAGRTVLIRHEAADELMEMMVRGMRRMAKIMEDVDIDPSELPPRLDNGVAFMGQQSENGDVEFMCYQVATDTVCDLGVDATAQATTELFDKDELPAEGRITLDEFRVAGRASTEPGISAIAVFMTAAVANFNAETGDPIMPASGVLEMTFGHWSCSLKNIEGTTSDAEKDQEVACVFSRKGSPLPELAPTAPAAPAAN